MAGGRARKALSVGRRFARRAMISRDDAELLAGVKTGLLPEDSDLDEGFVPQRTIGHAGIDLRTEHQLEFLTTLGTEEHRMLFEALRLDPEINVTFEGKEYAPLGLIHNGFFPTPDAEIYASMIIAERPETIIEVGSGYSTLVARRAIRHVGSTTKIHVVDPQPRREIGAFADEVEYLPVERSSLVDRGIAESTLLFIDSSHVCRAGGDLPFLFCEVLPSLPANVLVHVHDVFLPYDYPGSYARRFYTEQYLLHALLVHSAKFEIVFAAHHMAREHPQAMQAAFGAAVGRDRLFFGASFWMRTLGQGDPTSRV